jgi:ribosomal protein S18 acetylase RimI-like enzyme
MSIRTARVETDVPGISHVCLTCEPGSSDTEENIRAQFLRKSPGRVDLRLVAVEEDAVIGYCYIGHSAEMPARHFYIWVGVLPEYRCRGIGSALWDAGLAFLRKQGATRVSSETLDNDPAGLGFVQHRGFAIDRHRFHSHLDLETFDDTPYLPAIAQLEAQGIRFCTLADLPDTRETNDAFCELNLACVRDIPGEVWDFSTYPAFFKERILGARWFRREGNILALDGESWVGFATVSLNSEKHSAYNSTTGVIRAYRGRKIALALKVLAARYARLQGALQVNTDNDSLNAPMLAVNHRMGYQQEGGMYFLVRWFEF